MSAPAAVRDLGPRARAAATRLAAASTADKNTALLTAADLMLARSAELLAANRLDVEAAEADDMEPGPLDRLRLTEARLAGMAEGLRDVAALPDPVGEVLEGWRRPNGIQIEKVRVPLGVVAIIYENRPNVTSDAAGICLKSGNAALLRGSGSALRSNQAIVDVLRDAATKAGLPADCVLLVDDVRHEAAVELMQLTEYVDCLIPRGGRVADPEHPGPRHRARHHRRRRQLPRLRRRARRPRHGARHRRERQDEPAQRVQRGRVAARPRRGGRRLPPDACAGCSTEQGVELVGDDGARARWPGMGAATDDDFAREFLALKMSVAVVPSIDAAIAHVNRFGSAHTDAIVTRDLASARRFTREVDSGTVTVNASTRFTDGAEFGFGAEIGISTQKLHARGPMALRELTTYKYVVWGDGQIRT